MQLLELQNCQIAQDELPFTAPSPKPHHPVPGCPAGCVDIWGLVRSFIQLSHIPKSLPSMSPRGGIGLLARSLSVFKPLLLEEGPQQELLQGNCGVQLAGLPIAQGTCQPSGLWGQHPETALAAHHSRQQEHPPCRSCRSWQLLSEGHLQRRKMGLGSEKPSCNVIYLTLEPRIGHWQLSSQLELLQVLTLWLVWLYMTHLQACMGQARGKKETLCSWGHSQTSAQRRCMCRGSHLCPWAG